MSIRRKEAALPKVVPESMGLNALAELTQDEHKVVALGIEPGQLKPLQHLNEAAYKQHVRAGNFTKELIDQIEAHKRVSSEM